MSFEKPLKERIQRFLYTCMPLFKDISKLTTELQRQKLPEWQDDSFSDLTGPCHQDDAELFIRNLNKREQILREKRRGAFTPRLSELFAKYKKMNNKQTKLPGRPSKERDLTKSDQSADPPVVGTDVPTTKSPQSADLTAIGTRAPTTTKSSSKRQGPQTKAERYDVLSGAIDVLKAALDAKITKKINFVWPDIQSEEMKKDIDALEIIRTVLQNRKTSCERLSSGIEKLQNYIEEDIDCDFMKDNPAGVKNSVERLESIKLKYKTTLQRQSDHQEMVNDWLDHIQQLMKPKVSEPPKFEFSKLLDGKLINKMKQITTRLWSIVSNNRTFENKQTGVQENLDICCEKIGAVIETQATTAKKMKSTTDVKSKLSLLTDMTESLINRVRKTEEELTTERTNIKRLTDTKLKNMGTTAERLKAAEAELEREQSNIKKLTAAKDEMSKDIAMIAVRLKSAEEELKTERSTNKKLADEKDTMLESKARAEKGQQNLSDLEKQVQDYKDALHRLHCICKDKAIDESINGRTDSSKTKEFEKEYCDVQETVQLVMENISKMKEDYKVLRQEISASCFEIGTIGLTNGEKKPTTVLQRQDDVALLLSESIKKAEDRVADIKQRLANEESSRKQQSQSCLEHFKLIRETCQQILKQRKFRSGKRIGNSEQEEEADTENVEKSGAKAVELLMSLSERYNGLINSNEDYKEEVFQLKKGKQEAEKNNADLRYRLSKHMGAELMTDNPNIADLSDSNRPTKLAESFSELYDNDWTNAYEELQRRKNMPDIEIVNSLLEILKSAFEYCRNTADMQLKGLLVHVCTPAALQIDPPKKEVNPIEIDTVSKQALNELRKKTFAVASANLTKLSVEIMKHELKSKWNDAYASKSCQKYIKSCIDICWLMSIQSPPVHLDFTIDKKFDDKKYKAYSNRGKNIAYMVWPPIYIFKGGNLLAKGVVEGK